jgi:hypothetical protein
MQVTQRNAAAQQKRSRPNLCALRYVNDSKYRDNAALRTL